VSAPATHTAWEGVERLRPYLRAISELRPLAPATERDDVELLAEGLRRSGQVQPVLLSEDGRVIGRGYLLDAAELAGFTHVAARLAAAEEATDSVDQLSFVDALEANGGADAESLRGLVRRDPYAGSDELEVSAINEASADAATEWEGILEIVPGGGPLRVVVSVDGEEDRDALLGLLGIATIHKGTRGTISVWWPDREKKDLSSLRFVDATRDVESAPWWEDEEQLAARDDLDDVDLPF
jgi:hypothetical protein